MSYRSRLITPSAEEDIRPYAPVWFGLGLQIGILCAVVVAVYVLINFLGLALPTLLRRGFDLALVALPIALWVIFAVLPERRALEPRQRMITVCITSALVANAISLPLIEGVFQVDRWLPLGSAFNRIIGYTFTIGITQEALKYLVIRYVVWDDYFRTRLDGVAYGLASTVGYASVINLQFVIASDALPDVVAAQVLGSFSLNLIGSLVVGYVLAELRFSQPSPLIMAAGLAFAALLNGIIIPIRAGLVNASFSAAAAVNAPSLLFGIVLSIISMVGISVVMALLFANAERRAAEAAREA